MSHTRKRKLVARIWLCFTFIILTGAHYFFYRFSADPLNTFALTRGLTFGCVLWTTVLLGVVWMRHAWGRYVLITLICLAIVVFGLVALMLNNQSVDPIPGPVRMVIGGLVLYTAALVPLGASSALRRYLAPRTAGE